MAACMPSSTPRKPGTSRSDIRRVINRGLPGSAASAEYLCGPGLPCGEPPFGGRHVASESEELFNDLLFTLETSAKPAIVEAGEPSSTWSAQAGALMVRDRFDFGGVQETWRRPLALQPSTRAD